MAEEGTQTVESTESTAVESPAVEADLPATGGTPETKDNGEAAAAVAAAEQYTPNYKFRAPDAQGVTKDHEIPENFRNLIKDAKTEKEVHDIFTKAYGLDANKARSQQLSSDFTKTNTELSNYKQGVDALRSDYQRGDFDSFFKKLEIPQEKVLQWVLGKVEYSKLPPEQQAILDRKREAENQAFEASRSNQTLQGQMAEQARQLKTTMLNFTMSQPDIKALAESFESRTGKPGSFEQLVRQHGDYAFRTGRDLTPDQAVKEVIEQYGIKALHAVPSPQATVTQPGEEKPKVIPNMRGRSSASPVKPGPRSIEDLKKLAQNFGN